MKKPTIRKPFIMSEHIKHPSGKVKTICVTAYLTAIGVPLDSFQVTGSIKKHHYLSLINKIGLCARIRKSKMHKGMTIGVCRKGIKKLSENAVYFVIVQGNGYCHAMLLDNDGSTIVDTSPRKKDKRKVHSIHAIFIN